MLRSSESKTLATLGSYTHVLGMGARIGRLPPHQQGLSLERQFPGKFFILLHYDTGGPFIPFVCSRNSLEFKRYRDMAQGLPHCATIEVLKQKLRDSPHPQEHGFLFDKTGNVMLRSDMGTKRSVVSTVGPEFCFFYNQQEGLHSMHRHPPRLISPPSFEDVVTFLCSGHQSSTVVTDWECYTMGKIQRGPIAPDRIHEMYTSLLKFNATRLGIRAQFEGVTGGFSFYLSYWEDLLREFFKQYPNEICIKKEKF